MPAEQGPAGRDAERFAMAVEQGTPPGSVADDPELARDLEIAAMLSVSGDAFAPRPDEKARARQHLMARLAQIDSGSATTPAAGRVGDDDDTAVMPVVAPAGTLVEARPDGDPDATTVRRRPGRRASRHAMPSRPAGRPGARSAARGIGRRAVLVGTAALLAVVAVAGGSVFASRNALPGDALYGVKRVAESAGLAMTFDDTAKGRRQLQLATRRIDEVEQLAARGPAAASPELIQSTIKDFDSSTGAGSRTLLLTTDDAGHGAALGDLRAWAGEQTARLSVLRSALPTAVVPGADSSISLLGRILGRTEALGYRSSCTQVTSGVVDDLGPLPAQGACTPLPEGVTGGAPAGSTGHSGVTGTDPAPSGRSATGGPGSDTPGTIAPATNDGTVPGETGADPRSDTGTATPPTTTSAPSGGGNAPGPAPVPVPVPVPLPLVPPIQLPPLLPGQPGITIG